MNDHDSRWFDRSRKVMAVVLLCLSGQGCCRANCAEPEVLVGLPDSVVQSVSLCGAEGSCPRTNVDDYVSSKGQPDRAVLLPARISQGDEMLELQVSGFDDEGELLWTVDVRTAATGGGCGCAGPGRISLDGRGSTI
jgi:hypothetical protein